MTVTDRNDNAPVFSPPLPASLTILENASIGDVVQRLTAIDADSNANIQFAVDNDVFKIVPATGGRSATTKTADLVGESEGDKSKAVGGV